VNFKSHKITRIMTKANKIWQILALIGLFSFFAVSCEDDDDTAAAPSLTAPSAPSGLLVGGEATLDFTFKADGKLKSAVASVDKGTVVVENEASVKTLTTGTVKVKFTAPSTSGESTIKLTITDESNQIGESTLKVNVGTDVITITNTAVKDADIVAGKKYLLKKGTNYILDGLVYVESGATLTIEAGAVVRFKAAPTTGDNTSALIIAPGAKIFAEGTATDPIIMTAESDDLTATKLGATDVGLWGGLILLGKAPFSNNGSSTGTIEGIATTETRAAFGGTDAADNSGILKYVSIRHSGVGIAPGSEIQGLTLGGVGSGTSISYIDIFASGDDGVEWFGGTVDVNYLTVAFAEDDSFDWDNGWKGKGQFWFAIQRADIANHGGELDGAVPDGATLYSNPTIYNCTIIGSGSTSANTSNTPALYMRDATAGIFGNSIFTDFNNKLLEVEDLAADKGIDSYQRLKNGEVKFLNNLWFSAKTTLDASADGILQVTSTAEDATGTELINHLSTNKNKIVNPQLGGISRTGNAGLDPRPAAAEATTDLATFPTGFTSVTYKGAFAPTGDAWIKGWTTLAKKGFLK
jgi:hypothetical protein